MNLKAQLLITAIHSWIRTRLFLPDIIQNESNGNSKSDDECNLNLAIINFRSIINKKAEFLYFLQESKPRIIIGTETWLSNDIADNEIIPSKFSYTIYRKDRDSGYGGVMIAVSKDILSSPVPELVTSCEMTWCKLHFPGIKNVYICAYYRPHVSDQHSLNELNNSLAKLKEYNNNSIVWLAGDFNAPDINWESACIETGSNYPTIQTNLIDIIQDHGLSQVVMEPTRCSNILDLYFSRTIPDRFKRSRSFQD